MGPTAIRHLLYGINFVFVLTGIVLTCHGMENVLFYRHYGELVQPQYSYLSYHQITTGAFIFAVALLGWYGALAERPVVSLMFTTCLLLVFFLEVAAGVGGYFLNLTTRHSLTASMRLPNSSHDYEMLLRWQRLQNDFYCCGVERASDWQGVFEDGSIPESCCLPRTWWDQQATDCAAGNTHMLGCFVPLENSLQENCLGVIILGFSAAIVQLLGIVMTCYLSTEFRKGYASI